MGTYERDPIIATLASRACDQVHAGLKDLHAGNLLSAEVFLNAACATLSSLAILLEAPQPVRPFRKLAVVGPAKAEDADLQPWMSQKFGGPDDGNGAA